MSRELFLARKLIEAAADPYLAPAESDNAASELATFAVRFGAPEKRGYPVDVAYFERIRVDDLSAMAWLSLLESGEINDPVVPDNIPEQLFNSVADEVIRLRLVGAVLGHPRIHRDFEHALELEPAPTELANLPNCWPKFRLMRLDELSRSEGMPDDASPADGLQEFVLYLLQDGSLPARALAAAAIAPNESWREPAHRLAQNLVRSVDPDLSGYGAPFRRARV
jgi:hypothetical protein